MKMLNYRGKGELKFKFWEKDPLINNKSGVVKLRTIVRDFGR